MSDPKAWLERVAEKRRSTVANDFHNAVRQGETDPARIVARVAHECRQRATAAARYDRERGEEYLDAAEELARDSVAAHAYAAYVIWYEGLPYEERQKVKEARGEQGRLQAMERLAPTEKQLGYLRKLGYAGEVASRAEASSLIDQLVKGSA